MFDRRRQHFFDRDELAVYRYTTIGFSDVSGSYSYNPLVMIDCFFILCSLPFRLFNFLILNMF